MTHERIEEFLRLSGVVFYDTGMVEDETPAREGHILPYLNCPCPSHRNPETGAGRAFLFRDTWKVVCIHCGRESDIYAMAGYLHGETNTARLNEIVTATLNGTPLPDRQWASRMLRTDKGTPKMALGNMLLIFQHDPSWAGTLGFNERTQKVVFRRDPPPDVRAVAGDALTDEHVSRVTIWLQDSYQYAIKSGTIVYSAMIAAAYLCPFDPVREWLDALPPWDGVGRADRWLSDVTGCDATTYSGAVGSKVLISAIARVYEPGCKVDTVLVLHGPQGTFKSTLLAELVGRPEWFSDHLSDVGGKDACMELCGPWILEFSELDAITGKRESERVKSWITQQRDRFRPPYGRAIVDVPRRTIFTGTSNLGQFLRDETGGRRFLPIEIRDIDLDALRAMREQLWCEALARYRTGEKWWLEGAALDGAKVEQEDRRVSDPWEDAIRVWIDETRNSAVMSPNRDNNGRRIYTTAGEVLTSGVRVDVGRQTKGDLDRCARVLGNVLGWKRGTRRIGKTTAKVWYPPIEAENTVVDLHPVLPGVDRDEEWA